MNIYFSGVGGVGIGPLTEIAHDAGHSVVGSDLAESLTTKELQARGIEVNIGQDGEFLKAQHDKAKLDWFVYTAALPADHPELVTAKALGIRTGKRDEFLAEFIKEHKLQLIAISGTHGKTTTTGMMVWALKQLGVPVSYSVGTTLSFGPSGAYDPASKYFVYECDEYDRNMLNFSPFVSILPSVDYDHPDSYPTVDDYKDAFRRYIEQSSQTITWQAVLDYLNVSASAYVLGLSPDQVIDLKIAGEHNRRNATLLIKALDLMKIGEPNKNIEALLQFPGTDRRFEKLADNLYTDYGHHPEEIAATLQLAHELSDQIMLVYQPHQNRRQHQIKNDYTNQFELASSVYWLPTYLTREDQTQAILTPEELAANLTNRSSVHYAELNDELWDEIQAKRSAGNLVLCMGAGTIDGWVRRKLKTAD